ncbi:MAG: undecaprenyl-phosphate glucose phosphotransferase [Janthinobacterium lividum]
MRTASHTPAAYTWIEAQAGARAVSPGSSPVKLLGGAMAAADAAVVLVASIAAYLIRHGAVTMSEEVAVTTLLAAVLTVNSMALAGCYTRHVTAPLAAQVGRAMQGWSLVFVILLVVAYLAKVSDGFSRVWAVGWYVAVLFGIALVRTAAAAKVRQWRQRGKLARTVAVLDLTGTGDDLARRLLHSSVGEMRLVGVFAMQPATGRRNGIADLLAVSRLFRIDEVIIAASGAPGDLVDAAIRTIGTIPTHVRLCLDMPRTAATPLEAGLLYGEPVVTVYHRPMMGWSRVVKRAEDLVLTVVALIILAPLMCLIALLIKLDSPGPVLFRQARLGFNNNVITVYKFRSMLHRPSADTEVRQAQRNDPRFTRLGRFLRRTSLDELPQLFNVLQDGMSLVGPRPHALAHNDQYAALINGYLGRHRVQPGITGWAQVNGFRGETDTLEKMQRRVEHDLAYIDGWSLMLDIRILFMTVFSSSSQQNAF